MINTGVKCMVWSSINTGDCNFNTTVFAVQDHLIWFGRIDSTTISWNTLIYEFVQSARAIYGGYTAVHKFSLCFVYTGCPRNNGTVDTVDFSGICSDQVILFTLLDRASYSHYINTNIIKFGWELFILWVISYGLSSSEFARFPEFRGTMTN